MRVGPFTDGYLPEPSDVTTPVRWLKENLEAAGTRGDHLRAAQYSEAEDDAPSLFRFRSRPSLFRTALRVALPYNRRAARTFRDLNVLHSHSPFSLGLVALAKGTRYRIPHVLTDHRYLPSTGTACREPCALQRRQPKRPPRLPAIAAPP